jgi:hypothetical protein
MTQEDAEYVHATIENEGFDYTFDGYSDFKRIEDAKFHELRKAYLSARESLENYISSFVGDID